MEFNQTESIAYNGEYLNYDGMDPVEYKYFTRIRQLGIYSRSGKISNPNEIVTLRNQYYAQYQQERETQDKLEAYNVAWVACLKSTDSLRTLINFETDPAKIAVLALKAVYVMTNDSSMELKMHEMEEQIK